MEIVLIRHGLPMRVETKDGVAADPSLSRIGLMQAVEAADWLVGIKIEAIYSSPPHFDTFLTACWEQPLQGKI